MIRSLFRAVATILAFFIAGLPCAEPASAASARSVLGRPEKNSVSLTTQAIPAPLLNFIRRIPSGDSSRVSLTTAGELARTLGGGAAPVLDATTLTGLVFRHFNLLYETNEHDDSFEYESHPRWMLTEQMMPLYLYAFMDYQSHLSWWGKIRTRVRQFIHPEESIPLHVYPSTPGTPLAFLRSGHGPLALGISESLENGFIEALSESIRWLPGGTISRKTLEDSAMFDKATASVVAVIEFVLEHELNHWRFLRLSGRVPGGRFLDQADEFLRLQKSLRTLDQIRKTPRTAFLLDQSKSLSVLRSYLQNDLSPIAALKGVARWTALWELAGHAVEGAGSERIMRGRFSNKDA
jgi:hypothetical protein